MQFDKDIFISYAHIDDESLIADKKGWISEFHRALEIRLGQLLGYKPVIWRDPALQGNHIFDKEIVDQFSKVAIMISIFTPRYVKSDWCLKEANEFREVCQQNLGFIVNNKARIFKVIKTPVNLELHPDSLKGLLGYEFYGADPNTGRVKEYSPVFSHTEKGYWEKLDDLANDICVFLEELKGMNSPVAGASTTATTTLAATKNGTVKNIFLSESSYDTKDLRDNIKRELQDHGYNILPYGQLSLIAPVLKQNVDEYMKDAQVAIHLIGNSYGIVPEGTEKSIVEIQNELGASHSRSEHLPRLIWMPEEIDTDDERQKRFVNKLVSGDSDVLAGADMVKGSIEDFKSVIHDKLKKMEEKKEEVVEDQAMAGEEPRNKMVYIICDAQDADIIVPLEDHLFNSGVEVILPIFEGEETQIREDHIENLKNCSGVIIFYGNGNELWLRTKMRDLIKINGYGRQAPLDFKIVYVSGPVTPAKQRFRTLEAEVLNGMEGIPEQELKKLFAKK
jgi:TIR domain